MKKIIIIVSIVVVLLLGVGGFFAWKFLLQDDGHKKEETIEISELSAEELTELTFKMEEKTMIATNLSDGGGVSVKFDVVLENTKAKEEFEIRNSQVHSTALSILMSLTTENLIGEKGKTDLENTLKTKFNEFMKEGKVLEVWVTELSVM